MNGRAHFVFREQRCWLSLRGWEGETNSRQGQGESHSKREKDHRTLLPVYPGPVQQMGESTTRPPLCLEIHFMSDSWVDLVQQALPRSTLGRSVFLSFPAHTAIGEPDSRTFHPSTSPAL